jgi:hypothetical protein
LAQERKSIDRDQDDRKAEDEEKEKTEVLHLNFFPCAG